MKTTNIKSDPAQGRSCCSHDLTGRRFGRLRAVAPTGKKASDGSLYWLCECSCGNMTVVSSNKLLQKKTVSCGCYRREALHRSHTYVAGTCLEIINSEKVSKNNTSGAKGVSRSRGMWRANIVFAGKHFYLGRFNDFEDAVAIRKEAEKLRKEVINELDHMQVSALDVFAERIEDLREKERLFTMCPSAFAGELTPTENTATAGRALCESHGL